MMMRSEGRVVRRYDQHATKVQLIGKRGLIEEMVWYGEVVKRKGDGGD